MKTIIKTDTLRNALNKAVKCSSNNVNLPLTTMIAIDIRENKLGLTTTNGSDYLYIIETLDRDTEDFYVVVNADIINKLINKSACEEITLELVNDSLVVEGIGKYSIELPVDENGNLIIFPNPIRNFNVVSSYNIKKDDIDLILKSNKSALSTSFTEECYTGYYLANEVITCDGYRICNNNINITDTPILVRGTTFNLLEVTDSDMSIKINNNNEIIFVNAHCIVYGHLLECIDNFKINDIKNFINNELPYKCEINRNSLLKTLDRLNLFVGPFDSNGITLYFMKEGLRISNTKNDSVELVRYAYQNEINDFMCKVDIEMFKSLLNAETEETVAIWFGNTSCIKLEQNVTTQVLGLL